MKLFVNGKNEIKDVNTTTDTSLIEIDVVDDAEVNPFVGWSTAKICCYKVTVSNGMITSMTPYVDSRLIEHIDNLGKLNDKANNNLVQVEAAIEELYEMLLESEV